MTATLPTDSSSARSSRAAASWAAMDGNSAAARIAYKLSEVCAIYPITPASPMGEAADAWSYSQRPNLWGAVPDVIEMQSEAGAAGALHGAIQKGALGTTFTASQGLLLMIPNMFKMAGELSPVVIHVAARTVATHALSIFGDHSDVMAARSTGFAMLCSSSVQEAQDLALVAHASTLGSRVPFMHFFDGFRTSHEVAKIETIDDDTIRAMIDDRLIFEHRARGLDPDHPVLRGSAQNPDVFFQAREAANPFYASVADIVEQRMAELKLLTGRTYGLVDYHGSPDADRVLVVMGSGAGAAEEAVDALVGGGEKVGLLKIRLFRPFPSKALIDALPPTVNAVVVLDRTKEPGAVGEPLYQDVVTALAERASGDERMPTVIGGRYGLASKEFTPAMAKRALDELRESNPRKHFTVGIVDDVTKASLAHDPDFTTEDKESVRALFYGLGSDGTVSANKSTVKIIAEDTELFAQGYFVYDSKKSGSVTVSHLRFGPHEIRSSYLIDRASFIACHQFAFLDRHDVLEAAQPGATFLLNSPYPARETWDQLPAAVQQRIIDLELEVHVIDAYAVAKAAGMGKRINTVMQPCFFALSGVLPTDEAIAAIKASIEKTYAKRGREVIERNWAAVDSALGALEQLDYPRSVTGHQPPTRIPEHAPEFVQRVTARLLAGEGDRLPVSALPVDGSFPTGTAKWEKRTIAQEIPTWDKELCIDCGRCAFYCPHNAIQMKVFEPTELRDAPDDFESKPFRSKELPDALLTIQVSPDDCTGCGVCVDMCPAKSKEEVKHRAINMNPITEHLDRERRRFEFFDQIERADSSALDPATVKNSQTLEPLFEYSGACSGCGETPYLKLLTQLFGDRMLVANATGCSSIYGGNLPTTPWSVNSEGRGPAWSNSLFEDNAEFGLGMRLAHDHNLTRGRALLAELRPQLDDGLVDSILSNDQADQASVDAQRRHVAELEQRLEQIDTAAARELQSLADELVRRSVWIIGGDGWAYDIGSAGLDHVLASGRNVNVLVLDTEVYSNTGGQASKATPRGAVAKFATAGKQVPKKDLGMIASAYGDVYVAQVAIGANPTQTVKAFAEAEQWEGPSLVIAYSSCIAHGIDMTHSMSHQDEAVKSGYWPLYRYHPGLGKHEHPLQLDCKPPSLPLREFTSQEGRFAMLERSDPEAARHLIELAQADVDERWRLYEQLAGVERTIPHEHETERDNGGTARN